MDKRTYRVSADKLVGAEGAAVMAYVLELQNKCRDHRSDAEMDQAFAERQAQQRARDEHNARAKRLTEERIDRENREKAKEKEIKNHNNMLDRGMCEVMIDPEKPWRPDWMAEFVLPQVPEMQVAKIDKDLGTGALRFAVQKLEWMRQNGKQVRSPSGYVLEVARQVMDGKHTMWVEGEIAAQQPHLIVAEVRENKWQRQRRIEAHAQQRAYSG